MDHISSVQIMERAMSDVLCTSIAAKHHPLQIPEQGEESFATRSQSQTFLVPDAIQIFLPRALIILFCNINIQNVCTDFQFDLNGIRTDF